MPTFTPNYNLAKPLVNDPTDQDLWGGELNSDMDIIDSTMKAISDVADAAVSDYVPWTDFTPTVTLVGGSGNVVPQYSTNYGRYSRAGNTLYIEISLFGDGGNEGAGSGELRVALPFPVANTITRSFTAGYIRNVGYFPLMVSLAPGNSYIYFFALENSSGGGGPIAGSSQSATNREIQVNFFYEVS